MIKSVEYFIYNVMGLRKVKGFLEWLYNTEVYKNEKLWSLLCSIVPNLGVFISIVFSVFEKRARSKIDKKIKKT